MCLCAQIIIFCLFIRFAFFLDVTFFLLIPTQEHQRNCPERSIVEDYFTRIKSVDESSTEPAVSESIPASTENWDDVSKYTYNIEYHTTYAIFINLFVNLFFYINKLVRSSFI